jgi:protein-disulfide isomerase
MTTNTAPASPQPGKGQLGLSAADHSQGSKNAPLVLLEYGDYECPACIQAAPVTQHLMEIFGDRLRFVFRHNPLVGVHTHAELAAEAAEAAAARGQFWPMHHLLFTQTHHLKPAALTRYAETLGLDMKRFNGEMADRIYTQRVKEHCRAAAKTGTRSTPAFFLNGAVVDVSFGLEHLETTVKAALAKLPTADR